MCPELHLGFAGLHVVVSVHALLVLFGVGLGAWVAVQHPRVSRPLALATVAVVAIGGIGGARLLYVVQRGGPLTISGGMASFGGIPAGVLLIVLAARVARVRTGDLFDALSPAFLVAFGCGRLGCFAAGCCAGSVTSLPWAVVFPGLGPEPRHPLQLYSAMFDFVLAWWAMQRRAQPGVVAVRCAAGLGFGRVALEVLRDPAATDWVGSWVTAPQVCGLLLGVGAWWIGRELRRRPMFASPS
jgi:phosphatidylglycerol---prolipoprotein diacylglyceryl transferase